MSEKNLFTSESVSEGHPDKIADQISDAILDAILTQDPDAHVAAETVVYTGSVHVFGEISTTAYVNIDEIVRNTIKEIGYTDANFGFDYKTVGVHPSIVEQSPDIAQGVNESKEVRDTEQKDELDLIGAGDQGLMFGYACDETDTLMPFAIYYSHRLMQRQSELRKNGTLPWLRPDAKAQLTVVYDEETGQVKRIDTVVLSTQHDPDIDHKELEQAVIEHIIKPVLPENMITAETKYLVNPTGRFVIGGPQGDCGLTGRKIIVDTYGGAAPHGGGAFSGKDPSKVDRSAAYACRYVAKNIVAAGLAKQCQIQVSYAIGVAEPTSISVNTFGTGKISDDKIVDFIRQHFDLRPYGITRMLNLLQPMYEQTASYGHFGRQGTETAFTWERTDRAALLRADAGL